jgi:acetyl-CoA acetyltransferase
VERAGIDPGLIEDLVLGCGNPEGRQARNIGRQAAIRAGLPITVAGSTVSRFCASGLQAIADAAGRIVMDARSAIVAGGVESISGLRRRRGLEGGSDPWIVEHKPALYMAVIDTADIVAQRYGVSREARIASPLKASSAPKRTGGRPLPRGDRRRDDHDGRRRQVRAPPAARGDRRPRHLQPSRHTYKRSPSWRR